MPTPYNVLRGPGSVTPLTEHRPQPSSLRSALGCRSQHNPHLPTLRDASRVRVSRPQRGDIDPLWHCYLERSPDCSAPSERLNPVRWRVTKFFVGTVIKNITQPRSKVSLASDLHRPANFTSPTSSSQLRLLPLRLRFSLCTLVPEARCRRPTTSCAAVSYTHLTLPTIHLV